MISESYSYCALQGENFDPNPFLDDNRFEILEHRHVGELGGKGRFKDQILNFGYIRFKSRRGDFDDFVRELYLARDLLARNGAEIMELHLLLIYEKQCNWEFAPSLLKMISELGLRLTMTCDEKQDADT